MSDTARMQSAVPTAKGKPAAVPPQCACGCGQNDHGAERRSHGRENGDLIQRRTENGDPGCAHGLEDVLRIPGRPLEPAVRADMEHRFQADFSRVRVHTGGGARAAARAIDAAAFTVGDHVVLGADGYPPDTVAGRRFLAHELAHVVQQGPQTGAAPGRSLLSSSSAAEREAHAAAEAVSLGRPARIGERLAPGAVARQPIGESGPAGPVTAAGAAVQAAPPSGATGWLANIVIDLFVGQIAGSGPQQRIAAAAIRGFVFTLAKEATWEGAKQGIKELAKPTNTVEFAKGYEAGAILGFVSPVTDLFGIVVLAEQLNKMAGDIGRAAWEHPEELMAEARGLANEFKIFLANARKQLSAAELIKHLDEIGAAAEAAANAAGARAAHSMVQHFSGKGEEQPTEPGAAPAGPAAQLEHWATETRKKLTSTQWSRLGYNVGHDVGAATSNTLLFVFSLGTGEAIVKIGGELGKLGGLLARGGNIVAQFGEGIKAMETLIQALMSKPLKWLEPVLKPLFGLLERLQGFLRKILGFAEKEAAKVAVAAVEKGAAHAATSKPAAAAPQPAAVPKSRPVAKPRPAPKPAEVPAPAHAASEIEPEPGARVRVGTEAEPERSAENLLESEPATSPRKMQARVASGDVAPAPPKSVANVPPKPADEPVTAAASVPAVKPAPTTQPAPTTAPKAASPPAPSPAAAAPRAPRRTRRRIPRARRRATQYNRRRLEVSRRRWRALRNDALRRDPICPFCRVRPSATADHIEPLVDADAVADMGMMTREQAREAANDPRNLRGICNPCNSSKAGSPVGDSSVDPEWWTPPNPDQALIEHMRMMRRWPY